jgi:hypothetical protein
MIALVAVSDIGRQGEGVASKRGGGVPADRVSSDIDKGARAH